MDDTGKYVLRDEDYLPGSTWAKNFLKRHADRLARVLPTALDTTREKWQTVDNFAWWYYCVEHCLVKHNFASVTSGLMSRRRRRSSTSTRRSSRGSCGTRSAAGGS